MLDRPAEYLKRSWIVWASLATILAAGINAIGEPLHTLHATYGGISLQFAITAENANVILAEWRDRGIAGKALLAFRFDFLLILCYVLALGGGSMALAERFRRKWRMFAYRYVPPMQLLAGILDCFENWMVLEFIQHGSASEYGDEWVLGVALASALKFLLVAIGLLTIAAGLLAGPRHRRPALFSDVLHEELDLIRFKNAGQLPPRPPIGVQQRAWDFGLRGLAFSGGGIRSGTFCLGVLQALARAGRLRDFDYLSTVSGGGYIGSWFSAWIARHPQGADGVRAELGDAVGEPDTLRYLRAYSNYLTPWKGVLGPDLWTAVATYLRNLALNLLILVGAIWAAMAFVMLVVHWGNSDGNASLLAIFAVVAICVASGCLTLGITINEPTPVLRALRGEAGVVCSVVLPIFFAAVGGGLWWVNVVHGGAGSDWQSYVFLTALSGLLFWGVFWLFSLNVNNQLGARDVVLGSVAFVALALAAIEFWFGVMNAVLLVAAIAAVVAIVVVMRYRAPGIRRDALLAQAFFHYLLSSVAGIAVCVVLIVGVSNALLLPWLKDLEDCWSSIPHAMRSIRAAVAIILSPPLVLAGIASGVIVAIGLLGNRYSDQAREWWARLGAWLTIVALGWVSVFGFVLLVPGLLEWAPSFGGKYFNFALSSGWLLSTVTAVLLARRAPGEATPGAAARAFLAVAPHIFVVGILAVLANGLFEIATLYQGFHADWSAPEALGTALVDSVRNWGLVLPRLYGELFLMLALVALLFAVSVDVNRFSLHDFYRNRLVRCYLGASNPKRQQDLDRFTRFAASDDLPLCELEHTRGPYHLINAALNIVNRRRLAWQERKAAPFLFSPLFCGYWLPPTVESGERSRYCRTSTYADNGGDDPESRLTLGTAMAVSGAAVSSSMGYATTPAFAFLLTVLNVRLGCWLPNSGLSEIRATSPTVAAWYLMCELFGLTDERSQYVNLSDGGHFDNLGVYELIRRRCRTVISVDAGADPKRGFEDLGNLIRKCETDLGVHVVINVREIIPGTDGVSEMAYAEGTIQYPEGPGKLVYLKPSITDDMQKSAQILSYSRQRLNFPHQTTADQWFDETRFESYRALGELLAVKMLRFLASEQEAQPVNSAFSL